MAVYYLDAGVGSDANAGTSSGAPWASFAHAIANTANGDRVLVSNRATYNITSFQNFSNFEVVWIGTNSSFTVTGARPVLSGSGGSGAYMVYTNGVTTFYNQEFQAGGFNEAAQLRQGARAINCHFVGTTGIATARAVFIQFNGAIAYNCTCTNPNGDGFEITYGGIAYNCHAYDCGDDGFVINARGTAIGCVASDNGSDGFAYASSGAVYNCTSYNNAADGFEILNGTNPLCVGAHAINNGAYGFELQHESTLFHTVAGSGGTANTSGAYDRTHFSGAPEFEVDTQTADSPIADGSGGDPTLYDFAPASSSAGQIDLVPFAGFEYFGRTDTDGGAVSFGNTVATGGGVFLPFLRIG